MRMGTNMLAVDEPGFLGRVHALANLATSHAGVTYHVLIESGLL